MSDPRDEQTNGLEVIFGILIVWGVVTLLAMLLTPLAE